MSGLLRRALTSSADNSVAPKVVLCPLIAKLEPLPVEEEKELKEALLHVLGEAKNAKIEQKVDPSILGDVVVGFGQKVLDMSIKTRAAQMERFLRQPISFDGN